MDEKTIITDLSINTIMLQTGAKAATTALKGLNAVLSSIAEGIRDAFTVNGLEDYKNTVKRFGKDLADELLVLQLRFGKLKVALAQALAPIAALIAPILNDAMQAVIRFSDFLGQFLRGLIAGTVGNQAFTKSTENVTSSQKKLAAAVNKTGKAVRRSLAGFDQLERLNQPAGASGGVASAAKIPVEMEPYVPGDISEKAQALIQKVLEFLKPLQMIDLAPLRNALGTLGQAFVNLGKLAGTALSELWQNILTPFVTWIVEKLAPVFVEGFAAKLGMVTAAFEPLIAGLKLVWDALKPIVDYIGQQVVSKLQIWRDTYLALTKVFQEKSPVIVGIFQNIATMIQAAWTTISPILDEFKNKTGRNFDEISQTVSTVVGGVIDGLYELTSYLAMGFTGDWKSAWTGIKTFLKNTINGIIGLMNTMIARLVATLNAVISAANKISFTLPSWIPELGGKTFGLNLKTVTAPKIPYLAQGAVLPANKPFLAMVGDQRHGTNIEAPLTTIQEAVAGVLGDQTGAIVRGFEVSIQVQKEILEAVLGITIGDEVVGRAAERYRRRMAIMGGGY